MSFDPSKPFEVVSEGGPEQQGAPVVVGGGGFDAAQPYEMLPDAPAASAPAEAKVVPFDPSQPYESVPSSEGRLTFYTRFDDGPEYESGVTARQNPLTNKRQAEEGVTIAVDPAVIPYGAKVRIPALKDFSRNGDGIFIAHDTGGAVRSRKASGGKEPVLDVFVEGADKDRAQHKRNQIANIFGKDPVIYEVLEAPGVEGKPLGADASFWDKVQRRWGTGQAQADADQWSYAAATGAVTWEEAQAHEAKRDPGAKGERWYSEGFLSAVEMLPAMVDGLKSGAKSGAAGAATGAAVAAVAGQMGPQVLVPEEIVTVPGSAAAGWAVGQAYGSVDYWYKQGTGAFYADLRKEGIPHNVASNVAQVMGMPYAAIEYAQVSKLVPGVKDVARRAVVESLRNRLKLIAVETGKDYAENIGQEVMQELVGVASDAIGAAVSGVKPTGERATVWDRVWETTKQSALAMPFLIAPRAGLQMAVAMRGPKGGRVQEQKVGLDAVRMERPEVGHVDPLATAPGAVAPAQAGVTEAGLSGAPPIVVEPNAGQTVNKNWMVDEQVSAGKAMAEHYRKLREAQAAEGGKSNSDIMKSESSEGVEVSGFDPNQPYEVLPEVSEEEKAAEAAARAEMEAELAGAAEGLGGVELLDAINESGGLPSKTSGEYDVYRGELDNLMESSRGAQSAGVKGQFFGALFRKDAPPLDRLVVRLQERGFDVETPSDVFDLLDERQRTGRGVYGYDPELVPFSMKPEDPAAAAEEAKRGNEAMQGVISEHRDAVDAMVRPGLGPVTFLWGKPGVIDKKTGRLVKGFGVSHLIEQRNLEGDNGAEIAALMPEVIALGTATEAYGPEGGRRVNISHEGHTAVLSLFREGKHQTWLLTGWKDNAPGDVQGVNPTETYSQQPSGIQTDAGAGAQKPNGLKGDTFSQEGTDVNAVDFRAVPGDDLSGTWKPAALKKRAEAFQRIATQFLERRFAKEGLPRVEVVADLNVPVEGDRAMELAREYSRQGNRIEAFYDPFKKRIVLVAANLESEAALKQKVLHELVGHFGVEQVLRKEDAARFWAVTEGVWNKFSRSQFGEAWRQDHGYRTLAELAANYGFDPETKVGRARTAVEHLARMAEADPNVSWVRSVIAQLRDWLRKTFPNMNIQWSERDVMAFLTEVRRGLEGRGGKAKSGRGARFSMVKEAPVMGQAFRRWFGESKVVDAEGKPLVVYHGTQQDFNSFDPQHLGSSTGARSAKMGYFFTDSHAVASGYAEVGDGRRYVQAQHKVKSLARELLNAEAARFDAAQDGLPTEALIRRVNDLKQQLAQAEQEEKLIRTSGEAYWEEGASVLPVYLSLQNPKVRDFEGGDYRDYSFAALIAEAKAEGRDGVIMENVDDAVMKGGPAASTVYVVFKPEQIKSATGNRGTFDPESADIRFSMVPQQEEAEESAAGGAEKRRQFVESVKAAEGVHESVKAKVDSFYQVFTDKDAVKQARERINAIGLDAALVEVLETNARTNPPTKLTNVMGMDLLNRLQGQERFEDAARVAQHLAEQATSQAQAIQSLHLIARLTPEGIQYYAQRVINGAMQDAPPEVQEAAGQVNRLKGEMTAVRRGEATGAVLDVQKILAEANLSPEKMVELQQRFREILMQSGEVPGVAIERLTGLLMAHGGMERKKAEALAKRAVADFAKRVRKQREAMLKQLLKVNAPKQAVAKSMIEKWLTLNREGKLNDATLFAGIAKRFGFPMFTAEDGARIRELAGRYERQTDPELKLVAGAKMLETIHELVPPKLWGKVAALQNMAMLLNPKTMVRNVFGNAAMLVMNTAADGVNGWVVDPMVSLVSGKRTTSTLALGETMRGLAAPVVDLKKGFAAARAEGASLRGALSAGVDTMVTLARLTSAEKFDLQTVQQSYRHVFSSRFMRLFEDMMTVSLSVPDRAFQQAAFRASVQRQMAAAKRNGLEMAAPTQDMVAEARMDAAAATFKDPNFVQVALANIRRAINTVSTLGKTGDYGLGNIIFPFTQVPSSILLRGVEWSPLGFIRASYEGLRPLLKGGEFDQKTFGEAFTRAALGTGMVALGAWLYKLGVISAVPDDDRDMEAFRRSSGMGGYSVNVAELKRRMMSGNWWAPSGLPEEGDLIVNYDWLQPTAMPVAAGAEYIRTMERARIDEAKGKMVVLNGAAQAGLAGMTTLSDQPLLDGLTRLAKDMGDHGPFQGLLRQAVGAPGAFVPTAVAQVGQLRDNTVRETRAGGFFDQEFARVLTRLPGLESRYPVKYDAFGQAQERYQAGSNTLLNVMVNPAFVHHVRSTPISRELERVYRETGEAKLPKQAPVKLVVNGRQIEPTNEQLAEYRYFTGRFAMEGFGRLVASPAFAEKTTEYKAKVMGQLLESGASLGKMAVFGQVIPQEQAAAIRRMVPEVQEMTDTAAEMVRMRVRAALPQYLPQR